MRTGQRLTDAFNSARVELIDGRSKYAILSDCHRGDGSLSDDFTRNQNIYVHALEHYYHNGFTYIEAGDGDELWEHAKFKHIKDAHYDVFQTIKRFFDEGRLIMLWGNHNNYLRNPEYVASNYYTYLDEHAQVTHDLFVGLRPAEAVVLRVRERGQEFLVLHGHQGDFSNDQAWVPTMLSLKYFWRYLHAFGFRNPASPAKNAHKRHKIEKNYNKWIALHRKALICGHTHRLKYPRSGELPYFNTGSCVYPTSITAIEIADDCIQLVRWRVTANDAGILQVERHVIRGPDPLSTFDIR